MGKFISGNPIKHPHDPPLLGTLNKFKLLEMIMKVSTAAVAAIPIIQYILFLEDR
ncbi:MAG: hypothetical protein ACW96S_07625 [Promethearchaeota archaeon]